MKIDDFARRPFFQARALFFSVCMLFSAAALLSCAGAARSTGSAPGDGTPALAAHPEVLRGRLENGLSWQFLQNREPANRLFIRLAVKAGSVHEEDDQKGVAHFVEHMAFNGTEHFKKNELASYFETIGMAFGPEVNAYTSFTETVYMLEIPADDPEIIANTFLVLRDWAAGLSFDPEELDKERGVVIEEWRLGRNAEGRAGDLRVPFILEGSAYAERLPIGNPEIVRAISRERVVDFYRAWYRPESMNVTITGDADPEVVRSHIEKSLGSIPASPEQKTPSVPPLSFGGEPEVLIFRDPELRYATAQIFEAFPYEPVATEGALRRRLVRGIAFEAFNARLEENRLNGVSQLLAGSASSQRIAGPGRFTYVGFVPKPGRFREGLAEITAELERFERYGITAAELSRGRDSMLNAARQSWLDRDKASSGMYASQLLQEFLLEDPALSIDERKNLYERILPDISVAEVNASIEEWFDARGSRLFVSAPQDSADVPDEEELLGLWQAAPVADLGPWEDENLDTPLFEVPSGSKPLSIAGESVVPGTDIREWRLSNGARVLVLPTDFKDNQILVSAWSSGGTSLVSDADFPSAIVAGDWLEMSGLGEFSASGLSKKLAGKSVSLSPWLDESWEGFSGHSSVSDLETLFELAALHFASPRFSPEPWTALTDQLSAVASSRKNSPIEAFADLKTRLLYGGSIRRSNLTEELVALMDSGRAEKAWRGRFADPGDFTFLFVGSIDEALLKEHVLRYFGGTNSVSGAAGGADAKRETAKPSGIAFPSGIRSQTLVRGRDSGSRVFLAFGGEALPSGRDRDLFDSLVSLIDLRLRDVIREDMSGTYGATVGGSLVGFPENGYEITIEFGCEPGREDALTRAVLQEIRRLRDELPGEAEVTKLREAWRRSRETGLRNNGWWLSEIASRDMQGLPLSMIAESEPFLELLTAEGLRAQARKYLDPDRRVEAVLKPEE